ncbi:MAG TPA: hypothetical protein VJN94_11800 [Candidatus Binataceae bacterium]|nr:hypothetical protein [Candidatus Binataceae bacterium]
MSQNEAVKKLADAFSSMTFDQLGEAAEALHALKSLGVKEADKAIVGLKAITEILSDS